ncbi:hypothetical protein L484_015134 [Morus notabilis]|uniref:Uncharacterized protein n=2 Tax=Morus notabilis TaxID=981085 RepID=W9SHG7_9ROSA|nr:hypothetical protein L484_015134 [Morus notabilis]
MQDQIKVEKSNKFVNTITAIFKGKDIDTPIRIFKVPDSLTSAKPEAYIPQQIGFGPIHHFRRELQQMQMYKVVEARRIHNGFQSDLKFGEVAEVLKTIVSPSVRASYNIYLQMEDDDLASVMALDGLFLFNLLCCTGINKEALAKSSSLCHLVNSAGKRLAQKTIIQEAMMLENQIPIDVMKVILLIECWNNSKSQKMKIGSVIFPKILLGFCEFSSPLKTVENYPLYEALKRAHLLDLLYHLVTLKQSPETNPEEEEKEKKSLEDLSTEIASHEIISRKTRIEEVVKRRIRIPDGVEAAAGEILKTLAPPGFQKPIELVLGLLELPLSQTKSDIVSSLKEEEPPKEVFIPRASELDKAGVKFRVADHITGINFDRNKLSFYLPIIRINADFEVIIRNLVVYEAMIKSETEPLILNWYVELMNGLIQTAEDVAVLNKQQIISKSESTLDEQVAKIFSGMNKSVELTNIPQNLNDAVGGVKEYYNNLCWVSTSEFMNKSWRTTKKWFVVLAPLLALFLLAVQSFCSVYGCRRSSVKVSHTSHAQQVGSPLPSLRSHLI